MTYKTPAHASLDSHINYSFLVNSGLSETVREHQRVQNLAQLCYRRYRAGSPAESIRGTPLSSIPVYPFPIQLCRLRQGER